MVKKKAKTRTKSQKSPAWFIRVRGSYLPNSWQGWALYVPFITYLLTALGFALNRQDTITEVVMAVFPQWVAAAVVMTYIAAHNTK